MRLCQRGKAGVRLVKRLVTMRFYSNEAPCCPAMCQRISVNLPPHDQLFRLREKIPRWLAAAQLVDLVFVRGGRHWYGGLRSPASQVFPVEDQIKLKIKREAASDIGFARCERMN